MSDAIGLMAFYPEIRWAHIAAVTASGSLFALRGLLVQANRPRWAMAAPVRYLSYSIDTVLLTAALMLVTILPGAMFANGWLTVKLCWSWCTSCSVLSRSNEDVRHAPARFRSPRHCWCSSRSSGSPSRIIHSAGCYASRADSGVHSRKPWADPDRCHCSLIRSRQRCHGCPAGLTQVMGRDDSGS